MFEKLFKKVLYAHNHYKMPDRYLKVIANRLLEKLIFHKQINITVKVILLSGRVKDFYLVTLY